MEQYQLTNVSCCGILRSFGDGDTRWGGTPDEDAREVRKHTRLGSTSVLSKSPRR
jgi:hypothetical protein